MFNAFRRYKTLIFLWKYGMNTSLMSTTFIESELSDEEREKLGNLASIKGKALTLLGFQEFFEELFGKDSYQDPYHFYLDIIRTSLGDEFLTGQEIKELERGIQGLKRKGLSKPNYNTSVSKYFAGLINGIDILPSFELMLDNYRLRVQKNEELYGSFMPLQKQKSRAQNNVLKALLGRNVFNYSFMPLNKERIRGDIKHQLINTPVIVNERDHEITLMDYNMNEIEALSQVPIFFLDIDIGHISTLVYRTLFTSMSEGRPDIFVQSINPKGISDSLKLAIIFMELERRMYGCASIEEYLDPYIKCNYSFTRNYGIFTSSSASGQPITVIAYLNGGVIYTEPKYAQLLTMDKNVSINEDGVLYDNKAGITLWDKVYKGAYSPKNKNYNMILDSNRGKR